MKHMKKSMLITTILTVVLLVAALSTATFAWYTAQSAVTSELSTLTSAKSTSASLGVDTYNNGAASSFSVVSFTMSEQVFPMMPKAAPVKPAYAAGTAPGEAPVVYTVTATDNLGNIRDAYGLGTNPAIGDSIYITSEVTKYSAFVAGFNAAPINNSGIFIEDGTDMAAATIGTATIVGKSGQNTRASAFVVVNTNGQNSTPVKVQITIDTAGYSVLTYAPSDFYTGYANYYTRTGAGTEPSPYVYTELATMPTSFEADTYFVSNIKLAAKLRIAFFIDNNYVDTWGAGNVNFGVIENENDSSDFATTNYPHLASGASIYLGMLAPLKSYDIRIASWFDGTLLGVDDSGFGASFSLLFSKD